MPRSRQRSLVSTNAQCAHPFVLHSLDLVSRPAIESRLVSRIYRTSSYPGWSMALLRLPFNHCWKASSFMGIPTVIDRGWTWASRICCMRGMIRFSKLYPKSVGCKRMANLNSSVPIVPSDSQSWVVDSFPPNTVLGSAFPK